MILKTYARLFTTDTDRSLELLTNLYGCEPDYRFKMGALEISGIGDICIVQGTVKDLEPYRGSIGPLIVDNLQTTKAHLIDHGAVIVKDDFEAETGCFFYARHPDGAVVEYLQWKPDLIARLIPKPPTLPSPSA